MGEEQNEAMERLDAPVVFDRAEFDRLWKMADMNEIMHHVKSREIEIKEEKYTIEVFLMTDGGHPDSMNINVWMVKEVKQVE